MTKMQKFMIEHDLESVCVHECLPVKGFCHVCEQSRCTALAIGYPRGSDDPGETVLFNTCRECSVGCDVDDITDEVNRVLQSALRGGR